MEVTETERERVRERERSWGRKAGCKGILFAPGQWEKEKLENVLAEEKGSWRSLLAGTHATSQRSQSAIPITMVRTHTHWHTHIGTIGSQRFF